MSLFNVRRLKSIPILMAILILGADTRPDAVFYDTEGRSYYPAEFSGKWVFINYWATWCSPCYKEIPELNRLAREYKEKLLVFGVNFDQPDPTEMEAQIRQMKIDFPVFATDPGSRLGVDRPAVLPTTYVLTPDGRIETLVGEQTVESLLQVMAG